MFNCPDLQHCSCFFFQLKFEDFRVADEKKEKVRSLEDEAWIWAPGVFQGQALKFLSFCLRPGPAIKSATWNHWETALLGQSLAGSLKGRQIWQNPSRRQGGPLPKNGRGRLNKGKNGEC